MTIRTYLIVLVLLLAGTSVPGSQTPTGSLRLKLRTAAGQPLEKTTVRVRFPMIRYIFETPVLTDSTGVASIENLPPGRCPIHLEIIGFDDYSIDVFFKAGETTMIDAELEPVEEMTFVRLPNEPVRKLARACEQNEFSKVEFKSTIIDAQQWTALWSEFRLAAPVVDFKQSQVVAWLGRGDYSIATAKIRRVTYNPKQKITRVRIEVPETGDVTIPVITCVAEFALISPRPGTVVIE